MKQYFVERITDITNDLCAHVDAIDMDNKENIRQDLGKLYDYHHDNNHIHPLTNWHAHRIRCMSAIATKLKDKVKIWQCHYMVLEYFFERSKCKCHVRCREENGTNHDFFHRDSLNYVIYGSQALANACLYLVPYTAYDYSDIFDPIMDFLDPFIHGTKKHIEYIYSEITSDCEKPEYGLPWNPEYASTFLRILDKLATEQARSLKVTRRVL